VGYPDINNYPTALEFIEALIGYYRIASVDNIQCDVNESVQYDIQNMNPNNILDNIEHYIKDASERY
jgi:hypothetical protein